MGHRPEVSGSRVAVLVAAAGEQFADFVAPGRRTGWRSLYVVGTSDPTYVTDRQEQLVGDTVEVDGANHSLEIAGDVVASVDALAKVTRAVRRFVEP